LVELCELKLPTYYIDHPNRIVSKEEIHHFDFHHKLEKTTTHFLPAKDQLKIMVTSGASCPDALVEAVLEKLACFYISKESYQEKVNEIVAAD
jgi:4-hydroxy-3-methylbut-2-enyl diphosphate reductase